MFLVSLSDTNACAHAHTHARTIPTLEIIVPSRVRLRAVVARVSVPHKVFMKLSFRIM